MHSLPPGVTVFERGWLSANNILFHSGQRAALVDSGYCTHADQTVLLVKGALGDQPLDLLLNTHLHSDHCGGNAALQASYANLETRIPPGQAEHVRNWDPVALTYQPTGQRCPQFRMQGLLMPGMEVALGEGRWQIHGSPGHDPHSVILFEPNSRTLISADSLWENGFGVVFPELEGESAFDDIARTLDLIEKLNPLLVIPGHGKVFSHVEQSIAASRRRLEGFVRDPRKHAIHAAKVLLKFNLLEFQCVHLAEFIAWAAATPYFRLIHGRWAPRADVAQWVALLTDELINAGAARRDGDRILNV